MSAPLNLLAVEPGIRLNVMSDERRIPLATASNPWQEIHCDRESTQQMEQAP